MRGRHCSFNVKVAVFFSLTDSTFVMAFEMKFHPLNSCNLAPIGKASFTPHAPFVASRRASSCRPHVRQTKATSGMAFGAPRGIWSKLLTGATQSLLLTPRPQSRDATLTARVALVLGCSAFVMHCCVNFVCLKIRVTVLGTTHNASTAEPP